MDSHVMDWTQFILFFIGVFGLFIWNRTEARADIRHMENELKSNRDLILEVHKENSAQIMAIREEGRSFRDALAHETKDFHYRLLEIERDKKRN